MFAPSSRLLWLVGFVLLPTCAFPAIFPYGKRYLVITALFLLFIALLDAVISRHRLAGFSLIVPPLIRAVLNEQTNFSIELHNSRSDSRLRRPARKIRVAVALPLEVEPVSDDVLLPAPGPGQGLRGEMALLGRERGKFSINQGFLGGTSRLGLWQLRHAVAIKTAILVEPALAEIAKETARILVSHRHGGQRLTARNGRGREFEQLREYVPSDDFGDIDWKATARRRVPIVRDYQVEHTQDIYACVDFSRLAGRTVMSKDQVQTTVLDEYVRSTVMLHRAVRHTGDRFGFAAFSNRVDHFMKAAHAASFDPVFRQALYPLRPRMVAPAFDEICATVRNRVKRRALIVFFTSLAEPQLAESFLDASRILVRQHLVIVASPTDAHVEPLFSDSDVARVEDIYGKLAGHLLWTKLEEVRVALARIGVRMHTVAPGRLGLIAATEYLNVKERQLL